MSDLPGCSAGMPPFLAGIMLLSGVSTKRPLAILKVLPQVTIHSKIKAEPAYARSNRFVRKALCIAPYVLTLVLPVLPDGFLT
ncbi:hypothetical protein [Rhizorhapis sp. SPR117]|uniref:hypothetical protein n=1 Tax=Rhizorhapis sp. SPR117 TaxID=2912611 RepID=UPI001F3527BD|nr:hypothetical protein [Rhizorhapis sp. SPR117]